jgi:hypothetical protein
MVAARSASHNPRARKSLLRRTKKDERRRSRLATRRRLLCHQFCQLSPTQNVIILMRSAKFLLRRATIPVAPIALSGSGSAW